MEVTPLVDQGGHQDRFLLRIENAITLIVQLELFHLRTWIEVGLAERDRQCENAREYFELSVNRCWCSGSFIFRLGCQPLGLEFLNFERLDFTKLFVTELFQDNSVMGEFRHPPPTSICHDFDTLRRSFTWFQVTSSDTGLVFSAQNRLDLNVERSPFLK